VVEVQHRPPRRRSGLTVVVATPAHVRSWLELVREVEPLFGPMPEFEATLRRNIDRRSAYCVCLGEAVAGGLLLGGPAPSDRWIRWLAVRGSSRGVGVGAALVEAALARFAPPSTISLDTFGEDNREGAPARRLYLRYGFEPREMVNPGPEGRTCQRFVLKR
jgi:GNAT superfamily N-acetyltransferase